MTYILSTTYWECLTMLTTKKLAPGAFATFRDGVLTRYVILNGSLNVRYTANVYGICWVDQGVDRQEWIGSLRARKDKLEKRLQKSDAKGEEWRLAL